METFVIPTIDRILVLPVERDFQAHVALEANRIMGLRLKGHELFSISHQKGGIMVGSQAIVIDDNFVFNTTTPSHDTTPEEAATAQALCTCIQVFKDLTTRGAAPNQVFINVPLTVLMGERLHQFFRNSFPHTSAFGAKP